METLLNLLWVLVSGAIFARWIGQRRNLYRGSGPAVQMFALVCTVVLLFPVISATDDLQAAALAVETKDSQQNPNKCWAQRPCGHTNGSPTPPAILQSLVFPLGNDGVVILPLVASPPVSATSFPDPLQKRPPPSRLV